MSIMDELTAWDSFYVIVGSAAGGLIGLQFVVLTLIAQRPTIPVAETGATFGTPTVVHFGAVLLLSALLRAPWHTIVPIAALWGVIGLCGIVYALITTRRMGVQTGYLPEFEDWLFHALLPLLSYAVLLAAAFVAQQHLDETLFGVAAAVLLLLFIGIHNAWDSVAYHVFVNLRRDATQEPKGRP